MADQQNKDEKIRGTRPTMPPGARPAFPPGKKAALPAGKKPTLPPGKKPGLPSSPGGDGAPTGLTRKDFDSGQDVRWCPGCGDYAILATIQRLMPELGIPRENIVFISGIGCSSRFPYYMNTYGIHSIHGRAPSIATGLKSARPDLDVWVITGDGDALSIGGNHIIHLMRRNVDLQVLLFNNQIYGLTKGQYSPTSEIGKITKSSPYGSLDYPFNPVSLTLGAEASFVARTMDRDPKHMKGILNQAHDHRGTSFVEVYQNCNIFNDGAFFQFTEKKSKPETVLFIEHDKPLTFGNGKRGIRLDGLKLKVIDLENGTWSVDDCFVHDETNHDVATIIGRMLRQPGLPRPFGVFYREHRPTYNDQLYEQIRTVTKKKGNGDLNALLRSSETWEIS